MIINNKYKFIYIKSGKTASTSVELFLYQFCSENDIIGTISTPSILPKNHKGYSNVINPLIRFFFDNSRRYLVDLYKSFKNYKFYDHITATAIRDRISQHIWNEYFKFTIERNPWDKTLSHLHHLNYKKNKQLTINDYISRNKFCYNYPMYLDPLSNNIIVNKITYYEDLTNEINNIVDYLNIPCYFDNTHFNEKKHIRQDKRAYKDIFNKRQAKIIENKFYKEINIMGYTF